MNLYNSLRLLGLVNVLGLRREYLFRLEQSAKYLTTKYLTSNYLTVPLGVILCLTSNPLSTFGCVVLYNQPEFPYYEYRFILSVIHIWTLLLLFVLSESIRRKDLRSNPHFV